jgi:hypothetical protein
MLRISSGRGRSELLSRLDCFLAATIILGLALNATGTQLAAGRLQGEVTGIGADGIPFNIPGASLDLKTTPTGPATASVLSDEEGKYSVTELSPGPYTLEVSFPGFKTIVKTVTITARSTVTEDIRLELQGVSQTIDVTESVSTVAQQGAAPPETLATPQLTAAPVALQEFKESLPLLAGVVRTQDGKIHMNGLSESQSMLVIDSAQTVDPVTGSFAIDLPLDAIGSVDVQRTPFSAEYGGFTGGLTSIQTKPPASRWNFGLSEFNPSIRGKNGHMIGFDKATPRIRLTGPLTSKLSFAESFAYERIREAVPGLAWPRNDIRREGFNSFTNLQYLISAKQVLTLQGHVFPLRQQFANINALTPQSASSDLGQRGFSLGGADSYQAAGGLLSIYFRHTRVESYGRGQGLSDMRITPDGLAGNYFNSWARTGNQEEAGVNFDLPHKDGGWAKHALKIGGHVIHRSYDGTSRSRPVILVGPDGLTAGRIDFVGGGSLDAQDTQIAGFVQDHWTFNDRSAVDLGLRYSGQTLGGRADFAPRLGLVYSPDKAGKTVFRGGAGMFYDRVPLLVGDFDDNPTRVVSLGVPSAGSPPTPSSSFRNVCAQVTSAGPRVMSSCSDLGTTPYSISFQAGVEREVLPRLVARFAYLYSRSYKGSVVDPVTQPSGSMLLLSNRGGTRYHEYEATVRYRAGERSDLTVSYIHSRSSGDLNMVGEVLVPFEQPVIRPNLYANSAADVPSRVTAFGVFKLPWDLTFSPAADIHSGFPYSNVDALQNYVGAPNSQRFPTYFTLGVKGYKEFRVHMFPKAPKIRLGFYSINATNRNNPHDVFNNVASHSFGQFAGFEKRVNGIVLDFLH